MKLRKTFMGTPPAYAPSPRSQQGSARGAGIGMKDVAAIRQSSSRARRATPSR